MQNKRKLIWIFIAAALMVLTFKTVLSMSENLSFASLLDTLSRSNHIYLTLAVVSMCAYIAFKGMTFFILLDTFGNRRSVTNCLLFSAGDLYFSAVTPSASGGQPMCLYFMLKSGINAAAAAVTLIVSLLSIAVAALITGVAAFIMHFDMFMAVDTIPRLCVLGGVVILLLLICSSSLLLAKGGIILRVGIRVIRFLHKLRIIKKPDKLIARLRRVVEQYKECVKMTRGKGKRMILVLIMALGHKVTQISTTMLVHLALGGDPALASNVWASTSFAQLGSGCFPMPGGMGIVDYLLYCFFTLMMPRDKAIELELISRSVACYLCIIICGLGTLVGVIVYRVRKRGTLE